MFASHPALRYTLSTVEPRQRANLVPYVLIAGLLLFYAFWAGGAISRLSATADEPLHAIGAWQAHHRADYRINREDPPLWLHYVGAFLPESAVRLDYTPDHWRRSSAGTEDQLDYILPAVYGRGTTPEQIVRDGRRAMLLVALLLGASVATVAWKLAGSVAAVAATLVFTLEPMMLGHGPLVKNDLATALCFLWAAYAMGRVWQAKPAHVWFLVLAVALAAAVTTKYSGLILCAVVTLGLVLRALFGGEWSPLGLRLDSRLKRILGSAGLTVALALVVYLAIWTAYGFRFAPSSAAERFDMSALAQRTAKMDLLADASLRNPGSDPTPDPKDVAAWRPSLFLRSVLFAHEHRLLPEAMCAGLVYTYSSALFRPSMLLGAYSDTGFRAYFPVAWLAKTPLTLIALVGIGLVVAVWRRRVVAYGFLVLPAGIYLLSAITGGLNIGLRHLIPLYPFLLVGVGLLAAWAVRAIPRRAIVPGGVALAVLLAAEVLPHRYRYIQFFNLAAGGERGGLRLLSDSNLDWGQDLYRLIEWQRANPHEPLYFCYFGVAPPSALGLKYTNVPGSWARPVDPNRPPAPGSVLAISATHLQGTYFYRDLREEMAKWRTREPLAILGGTIYLYRVPSE